MSNQCFWISILDYIKAHYPLLSELTLRQLRTWVGLDYTTEHIMFDSSYEYFRNAVLKLLIMFNTAGNPLKIKVYRFNDRDIISRADAFALDSTGTGFNQNIHEIFDDDDGDIIRIANFGQGHFQLITNIDKDSAIQFYDPHAMPSSSRPHPSHAMPSTFAPHVKSPYREDPCDYEPYVLIDDKYVPLSTISKKKQEYFNNLNKYLISLEILKDKEKYYKNKKNEILAEINTINSSSEYNDREKEGFIIQKQKEIKNIDDVIIKIELKIRQAPEEISSLNFLINSKDIE